MCASQTRVNFERCRTYTNEIAATFSQFKPRCDELVKLIDLSEELLKRTVANVMVADGAGADVAEHDLLHAFADPVHALAPS